MRVEGDEDSEGDEEDAEEEGMYLCSISAFQLLPQEKEISCFLFISAIVEFITGLRPRASWSLPAGR
jgi:hypothetical protein